MNALLWGLFVGLAVIWLVRMVRKGGCCGGEETPNRNNQKVTKQ